MADAPLDAIEATHPELRGSLLAGRDAWRRAAAADKEFSNWERRFFGGVDLFEYHVERIATLDDELLSNGDQPCSFVHPVLWYSENHNLVPEGGKIRPSALPTPSTFAIVGDVAVVIVTVGEGWMPIVTKISDIVSARWVHVGGVLVVPKYPGLQLELLENGEADTELICFPRFAPGGLDSVKRTVAMALGIELRTAPESAAGSWAPDPYRRHDHRWFNGSEWTDRVADNGQVGTDPPTYPGPEVAGWTHDPYGRFPQRYFNEGWTRHVARNGETFEDPATFPGPAAPDAELPSPTE